MYQDTDKVHDIDSITETQLLSPGQSNITPTSNLLPQISDLSNMSSDIQTANKTQSNASTIFDNNPFAGLSFAQNYNNEHNNFLDVKSVNELTANLNLGQSAKNDSTHSISVPVPVPAAFSCGAGNKNPNPSLTQDSLITQDDSNHNQFFNHLSSVSKSNLPHSQNQLINSFSLEAASDFVVSGGNISMHNKDKMVNGESLIHSIGVLWVYFHETNFFEKKSYSSSFECEEKVQKTETKKIILKKT